MMTAEQEAEARAFADSDEPLEMRRENMLAAFLRRDGRQRTARLLAEIDRLRAAQGAVRAEAVLDEGLVKALATAALVESERIVKQAREFDRTGVSTAAHRDLGAQWDTCFEVVFRDLLGATGEPRPVPVERVRHPQHYNKGPIEADGTAKYEAIKIIEDRGLGFCLGNALKYVLRAPHKGNEREDLEKACWYLARDSDEAVNSDVLGQLAGKRILSKTDVVAAWGLSGELAQAADAIMSKDADRALAAVRAHLEKK